MWHEDDPDLRSVYVVAVYFVDPAFGGVEEGGWWYTTGELEGTIGAFTDEEEAYGLAYEFNRPVWKDGANRGDRLEARVYQLGRKELRPEVAAERCHADWDEQPDDYVIRWDVPKYFPEYRPHYC